MPQIGAVSWLVRLTGPRFSVHLFIKMLVVVASSGCVGTRPALSAHCSASRIQLIHAATFAKWVKSAFELAPGPVKKMDARLSQPRRQSLTNNGRKGVWEWTGRLCYGNAVRSGP